MINNIFNLIRMGYRVEFAPSVSDNGMIEVTLHKGIGHSRLTVTPEELEEQSLTIFVSLLKVFPDETVHE